MLLLLCTILSSSPTDAGRYSLLYQQGLVAEATTDAPNPRDKRTKGRSIPLISSWLCFLSNGFQKDDDLTRYGRAGKVKLFVIRHRYVSLVVFAAGWLGNVHM